MKKVAKILLVLLSILILSGCGDKYAINSQESDLIAEYIAGAVLKYNGDGLLQQQQIAIEQNKDKEKETATGGQKPTQGQAQKPTASQGGSENNTTGSSGTEGTVSDASVMTQLANNLGLGNVSIAYTGYEKGDKYPIDGVFSVPANSNSVVFGFEFDMKNNSGADVVANTEASPIIFKLLIDGETKIQAASLLVNDMTGLKNITIKAGETYKAAVIFQIPKAIADSTAGMSLQVYSNGELLGVVPGVSG